MFDFTYYIVGTEIDKSHNKFRSLVGVLSEGRVDAFSQNPKSISSFESDREGWGSETEGLKSDMVIVILSGSLRA